LVEGCRLRLTLRMFALCESRELDAGSHLT